MKNSFTSSITRSTFVLTFILLAVLLSRSRLLCAEISREGTGMVIAMRPVVLKDNVDLLQFEKFIIEEFNPALEGRIPGFEMYIAKADRGSNKGNYVHFCVIQSQKVRNLLFPEGEQPAEWYSKIWNDYKLDPLAEKLNSFCVEGWNDNYTDYVVLR
jgi:hypothetical protein